MKYYFIKIISCFCIVFFVNGCHTFEHKNIFIQNINKNSNKEILNKENKNSKSSIRESKNKNEMAPISTPKQTELVKKLALQKKVKKLNANNFSLERLMSWDEEKLIKALGKSNFIKEEGKLKNYQYHFKECFLDVFLLKKNGIYIVNYVEKRPTKLNGSINIKDCSEELNQKLN